MSRHARLALALSVLAPALGCGGSPSDAPVTPPTGAPVTVTITANGVSPKNVDIALGDRVVFVNNDNVAHSIGSNPHPDHTDCPSINQAGFLLPGQTRETGNFVTARTCGFHDHNDPLNQSLWGTITTK